MKRLQRLSAFVMFGMATITGCGLGGSLALDNDGLTGEFHYTLRDDGLVQETVDSLDELATKVKGELLTSTFGDVGIVTAGVLASLPPDADVVFVVDNTGSMLWAIESIQIAVAEAMEAAPDRHYGVVSYRDLGDSYIHKVQAPLSANLSLSLAGVDAMEAWEGGDFPEFVASGLDAGLNQPWREGKERHIILVGDAPDKGYTDIAVTMDSVAAKAEALGVVIHAIGVPCGDKCEEEIGAK
jgi:hypothetical protein